MMWVDLFQFLIAIALFFVVDWAMETKFRAQQERHDDEKNLERRVRKYCPEEI